MGDSRIDKALARIDAALSRMDAARARPAPPSPAPSNEATGAKDQASSARVMELVNRHEKLREEVADSLRDLDALIDDLEG
jgi:hypothetical protein